MNIRKLKWLRILLNICFILTGFILPLLIVGDRLDIVTEVTKRKLSIVAIILIISIAYSFKKSILEYINSLEYSYFKSIFLGLSKVSFLILILGLEITASAVIKNASQETLQSLLNTLDALRYCLRWWCILSIIAHLGIRPLMDRCTHYIAKEARKDELREVLKE